MHYYIFCCHVTRFFSSPIILCPPPLIMLIMASCEKIDLPLIMASCEKNTLATRNVFHKFAKFLVMPHYTVAMNFYP